MKLREIRKTTSLRGIDPVYVDVISDIWILFWILQPLPVVGFIMYILPLARRVRNRNTNGEIVPVTMFIGSISSVLWVKILELSPGV